MVNEILRITFFTFQFAVLLLFVLILEIALGVFLYIGKHEIETAFFENYDFFADYQTGNSTIDKEVDDTQQSVSLHQKSPMYPHELPKSCPV